MFGIKNKNQLKEDTKYCTDCKEKINNEEIQNLINKKQSLIEEINKLTNTKNGLDIQIKNREEFFITTELKYIDTLNGLEFEKYITILLNKLGYKAQTTKASQDNGGDIIAEINNEKYVFQCKKYSETVGNKAIQEVYTAKGIYGCDNAVVITNNFFTKQAKEEADILKIKLCDRELLKVLLCQYFSFNLEHIDFRDNNYIEEYNDEPDPNLMDAIELVVEIGKVSTSFIQRRFKVGYAQAGRIIDQMEERGIISGYQGNKPREVLMTKERWKELKDNYK